MRNLLLFLTTFALLSVKGFAQQYEEEGNKYPLITDGNKHIVSGFVSFNDLDDEVIFTNSLLWAIENVSPKLRENLSNISIKKKSFEAAITLGMEANGNVYHCKGTFHITERKLVYHLSDMTLESAGFLSSKTTPFESLNPIKKEAHKMAMDDFTNQESDMLNKLFDYILTNKAENVTHWEEIEKQKATKGMNETECRLAFGKPQDIQDNGEETQWMYTSSFYLFFKDGLLNTIIK